MTTQVGTLAIKQTDVTQRIVDILDEFKNDLGIANVYYGRQEIIPEFPAVQVDATNKRRTLAGPGSTHRFSLNFSIGILIEHGKMQPSTITKQDVEIMAERVESKLHEDFYLGGLVIFGWVASIDYGVTIRNSVMYRATRLGWEGLSRENF
jgi:hypothetical protein